MAEHPRRVALIRLGDELCSLAGHLAAAEARWLCLRAEFDHDDGAIVGSFRLPPAEGMVFLKGLNAERVREYDGVPVGERPDLDEQAAVALVAMGEADLADIDPTGSRFLITVHTDGPTLAGENTGRVPTIDDGPALPVATAQRLACDGKVNRMVWGPGSEIHDTIIIDLLARERRAAEAAAELAEAA